MAVRFEVAQQVARPTVLPARSTLLDHASVVDADSFNPRNNEGLWPSYNTLPIPELVAICGGVPVSENPAPPAWAPAVEFALRSETSCHWMGLDEADQVKQLEAVFELNEHKGLNKALRNTRFIATGSGDLIEWDVASVPIPASLGTTAPLKNVVPLLEGYASCVYAGRPTLHVPASAIDAASSVSPFVWEGDKCFTKAGSKVVVDECSYSEDTSSPALVYVTGEVYIERTPLTVAQKLMLPGMGAGGGSDEGIADGQTLAVAERLYRVAVDGFVASLKVAI